MLPNPSPRKVTFEFAESPRSLGFQHVEVRLEGPKMRGPWKRWRKGLEYSPFFDIYGYLCLISGVYKVAIGGTNPYGS